jgi:hypothetical protein
MSKSTVRGSWFLVALFALAGTTAAVGLSCSTDDVKESTRPEPPPGEVDAGEGADLGTSCPESPPKVGDNCRASSADEVCMYDDGTCTIEGQTYSKTLSYRCGTEGTWSKWAPEPGMCDQP